MFQDGVGVGMPAIISQQSAVISRQSALPENWQLEADS